MVVKIYKFTVFLSYNDDYSRIWGYHTYKFKRENIRDSNDSFIVLLICLLRQHNRLDISGKIIKRSSFQVIKILTFKLYEEQKYKKWDSIKSLKIPWLHEIKGTVRSGKSPWNPFKNISTFERGDSERSFFEVYLRFKDFFSKFFW